MIEYLTIGTVALLASVSPGPDFAIVAKNALSQNRKMAILTSLGVGSGMLFHAAYCILGFAVIIANSPFIYSLIKYLGASYLIYLGLKSLFSKNNQLAERVQFQASDSSGALKAFLDGLLTNVLNPKVTLFILSIFTVIMNSEVSRLAQVGFGIEIACITTVWFVFLSVGLTHQSIYQKINTVQHVVNKIIGCILIALGFIVIL